jgi:glycerophosphoryl diester phosphodiesterase
MTTHLVAHRGAAATHPENSLSALQAAVECGIRHVEFDVQLSADRIPVVIHDADLRRTGGVSVSVLDTCLARLREHSIGEPRRLGERFAGERLAALDTIADWLATQSQLRAFVELKPESLQRFGVDAMLEAVDTVLHPICERVVLISFVSEVARQASVHGYAGGWVLPRYRGAAQARARELKPDFLICDRRRLPRSSRPLWPGPWQWMSYEVTRPDQLRQLREQGVTYAESMDCCGLQRQLEAGDGGT